MGDDHDAFRHRVATTVRFGDLDAMGHLNNVALLRLLETGRVDYMVDLGLATHDELTFVLARLEVDFTAQSFFRDELTCGSRIRSLGRTSMRFEQRVWSGTGDVVAKASSVLVKLSEDKATAELVPDLWRERITAWEPDDPDDVAGDHARD